MVSCGISCQICSNHWARSSTFPIRCSRLPNISQTCTIEERSGDLAGQGNILQANVIDAPLVCKWASNDHQTGPAVKRNCIPDHNSQLRACVACNSESRIGMMPWVSPDTSPMIVRAQLEVGFIA
ncbi:hypothetical protein TNCV_3262651 [Trichonephila clavipes]|nr:hypothetical protein TNCV_3262651 [Trichonephila clavipes]